MGAVKEGEEREKGREGERVRHETVQLSIITTKALPTPYTGTTQYTIMIGQIHPL